jgi:sugar phosphate isomerase/epimerase
MTILRNRREFLRDTLFAAGAITADSLRAQGFPSWTLGANTAVTGYGLFEAIALIRGLGFETIEIQPMGKIAATPGQFPGFHFDRISDADKRRIRESLKGFRYVTAHLPYTDLHWLSRFEPTAEFSTKQVDIALEAAAYYECKVAVIHPEVANGQTMEQSWPELVRRIRRWGDRAQKAGIRLALETGYPRSVRDYLRLIREIDHDSVGSTLDVGHQAHYEELVANVKPEERGTPKGIRAYNDTIHAIIDGLGPKLFHFHIHDIEPQTWAEHKPLIYGFVDYPRLLAKLKRVNYRGLLIFEIGGPASEMSKYLAEAKAKLEAYMAAV